MSKQLETGLSPNEVQRLIKENTLALKLNGIEEQYAEAFRERLQEALGLRLNVDSEFVSNVIFSEWERVLQDRRQDSRETAIAAEVA